MPAGKKYGGRKKGVPNKKTAEQLDRAEKIIQIIERDYLMYDLESIGPKTRMLLFSDLLEYVQPKLTRVDNTGEIKQELTIKIDRGSNVKPK